MHGEAFNEGPRQKAYLMPGMGKFHFAISAANAQCQAFFAQGVSQLHGFWFWVAERSFCQLAALDPDCAMAYRGMAMAKIENENRAREFIARGVGLKS